METFTAIVCSECGGHYVKAEHMATPVASDFACDTCGHEVNAYDVQLDEGESLVYGPSVLGYITSGTY